MMKNNRWFIMIPATRETNNACHQFIINENQSKQVTDCNDLTMMLDLHAIELVSNLTLKAHLHQANSTPWQYINDML